MESAIYGSFYIVKYILNEQVRWIWVIMHVGRFL